MENPTGRINLWRRKFREILWKIELQVLLRLWGYTCEELSLCTRHFNISSREMFLTEVGTIQESLSNLLVWHFHRLMGVQPLWITNWTMVLQGERKVTPSPYHQSFSAGGRIHPSKGKQQTRRPAEETAFKLTEGPWEMSWCLPWLHPLFSYGCLSALSLYVALHPEKICVYVWGLVQGPGSWGYENMNMHKPLTDQSIA